MFRSFNKTEIKNKIIKGHPLSIITCRKVKVKSFFKYEKNQEWRSQQVVKWS